MGDSIEGFGLKEVGWNYDSEFLPEVVGWKSKFYKYRSKNGSKDLQINVHDPTTGKKGFSSPTIAKCKFYVSKDKRTQSSIAVEEIDPQNDENDDVKPPPQDWVQDELGHPEVVKQEPVNVELEIIQLLERLNIDDYASVVLIPKKGKQIAYIDLTQDDQSE